jgi:hypothetical protein
LKEENWSKGCLKKKKTKDGKWFNNQLNIRFNEDQYLNPLPTIDFTTTAAEIPCKIEESYHDNIFRLFQSLTNSSSFQTVEKLLDEKDFIFRDAMDFLRSITHYPLYGSQKLDANFDNILLCNNLPSTLYFAKETKPDGNCWYRAISYLLFNSEDNYHVIKICCIFIFFKYKTFFSDLLIKEHYGITFQQMIIYHLVQNQWADNLIKIASCFLLDRSIYTFSVRKSLSDKSSQKLISHCFHYSFKNLTAKPILIGFSINHFVPILNNENNNEPLPYIQNITALNFDYVND